MEKCVLEISYLDNSATTAVCDAAAQKALYMMQHCYGNPSSLHRLGFEAEREIRDAEQHIRRLLGVTDGNLLFTSGGTEANNLAVIGAATARQKRGKHIVTTAVEHASVTGACAHLESLGFSVTYLKPDQDGSISEKAIIEACQPDTVVVSVMAVNNETGARFHLEKAAAHIRKRSPLAFLHIDAVQAAGKIPLQPLCKQADAVTVSAHKLHAPKGCGALYLKKDARILPRQYGGKQQNGLRSGTEAAPLIAAFGAAVEAMPPIADTYAHCEHLKNLLIERLADTPHIVWHLPKDGVPHIIHLSVIGLRSETVLHFLSERNIFVSSGSACSKGAKSPVLTAMGLPVAEIDSAIRISLCRDNTEQDIIRFADGLQQAIQTLAHTHS